MYSVLSSMARIPFFIDQRFRLLMLICCSREWQSSWKRHKKIVLTRIHSSRMRTVRLLTVSRSAHTHTRARARARTHTLQTRSRHPLRQTPPRTDTPLLGREPLGRHSPKDQRQTSPLWTRFLTHACENITVAGGKNLPKKMSTNS